MTIEEYLNKWLVLSGLEADTFQVEVVKEDDRILVNLVIPEEKAGFYIGYRGETLEAIQQIVRLTFREAEEKIIVDVNNYKYQREQVLLEKAERIARELLETGSRFAFRNLNSYERFLVHDFISNHQDFAQKLETFSQDDLNGRVLIMQIKEA